MCDLCIQIDGLCSLRLMETPRERIKSERRSRLRERVESTALSEWVDKDMPV